MTIWRASEADLSQLMGWAHAFCAHHPLTAQVGGDPRAIDAALRRMMADESSVILMHEHGAIGGVIAPLWINPGVRIATELFWWAERDGRALMRAFEEWAAEKEATLVQMIAILGARDVTPIYDRAGYLPVELNFIKAA